MSRGNRTWLLVLGVLLAAAGGLGLARGLGAFGTAAAAGPVLPPEAAGLARDNGWFWPVVGVVAALVAAAALWWLLAQVGGHRLRRLRLDTGPMGVTEVGGAPAARALAEQVMTYPDVRHARAAMSGSGRSPRLDLRIGARHTADVPALLARIRDEAVPDLRTALELERLPAVVRLGFVWGGKRRTVE